MNRVLHFFVELAFWILTFLSPVLGFAFFSVFLFFTLQLGFEVVILVMALGVIIGVIFAEKIRRKFGCSSYWARIMSTPDIGDKSGG